MQFCTAVILHNKHETLQGQFYKYMNSIVLNIINQKENPLNIIHMQ